jgi:hypothetical protein
VRLVVVGVAGKVYANFERGLRTRVFARLDSNASAASGTGGGGVYDDDDDDDEHGGHIPRLNINI